MADVMQPPKGGEPDTPEQKKPVPLVNDGLSPSDVDFIPPLVHSLVTLLRLRGKSVSTAFLMAGLAGTGRVSPGACLHAAKRAGLEGKIVYRKSLQDISTLVLPCILLLSRDRSCVLTSLDDGKAEVIFPETGEGVQPVPLQMLADEYTGYAIFATREARLDQRADRIRLLKGKRWFWDVLLYYMPIYRHVAFASVVINLIGVISPLFVMNVYDRVIPNNAVDTLWVLAIGDYVTKPFSMPVLLEKIRVILRRNTGAAESCLRYRDLTMRLDAKPESTGALVNNLREFESLREFFSSSTLLAFIDLPFLVVALLLLGYIGGPLVILPLCAIPVLIITGIVLQEAGKRTAEQGYKQNMQKNALLVELVNGLETLKACMAESRMLHLWEQVVGVSAKAGSVAKKYNNLAITISTLVTQAVSVGMVIWGVYRIADGTMTMGGLIGSNILVGRAMAPLMQIASLLTRLQNSRMSLQALDLLMQLPSEGQNDNEYVEFGKLDASFSFEDLAFAYPGAERLALTDISVFIKPGEKVGVVGRMGSGKSTLGKMLIGLYQPRDGAVKFGGVDIRQLAEADLRGRVGFLPQDVVLFYGTIRDNIALGDPTINDQMILRASTLAGVTEFIRSNPAGFGAQVGERGMSLSGGQRQAVALARALVRDPDILILDEPTSNMDNASEQMIKNRLKAVMGNKTLVLITHRLSMLELVDRLIVMEGGRIIADGPKNEVLRRLREQPAPRTEQ